MNRIGTAELQIHAVEYVLLVAFGMDDLEFLWIEETACIQAIRRKEIAPLRASKRHIKAPVRRPETSVRSSHTADRFCLTKTGARRYLDDQAGLVSEFSGWRAGDHFQRLNRIDRDLVGEDFARLVRNWLAIDRKRTFRMVADGVNQAVGIRYRARCGQRHERAH